MASNIDLSYGRDPSQPVPKVGDFVKVQETGDFGVVVSEAPGGTSQSGIPLPPNYVISIEGGRTVNYPAQHLVLRRRGALEVTPEVREALLTPPPGNAPASYKAGLYSEDPQAQTQSKQMISQQYQKERQDVFERQVALQQQKDYETQQKKNYVDYVSKQQKQAQTQSIVAQTLTNEPIHYTSTAEVPIQRDISKIPTYSINQVLSGEAALGTALKTRGEIVKLNPDNTISYTVDNTKSIPLPKDTSDYLTGKTPFIQVPERTIYGKETVSAQSLQAQEKQQAQTFKDIEVYQEQRKAATDTFGKAFDTASPIFFPETIVGVKTRSEFVKKTIEGAAFAAPDTAATISQAPFIASRPIETGKAIIEQAKQNPVGFAGEMVGQAIFFGAAGKAVGTIRGTNTKPEIISAEVGNVYNIGKRQIFIEARGKVASQGKIYDIQSETISQAPKKISDQPSKMLVSQTDLTIRSSRSLPFPKTNVNKFELESGFSVSKGSLEVTKDLPGGSVSTSKPGIVSQGITTVDEIVSERNVYRKPYTETVETIFKTETGEPIVFARENPPAIVTTQILKKRENIISQSYGTQIDDTTRVAAIAKSGEREAFGVGVYREVKPKEDVPMGFYPIKEPKTPVGTIERIPFAEQVGMESITKGSLLIKNTQTPKGLPKGMIELPSKPLSKSEFSIKPSVKTQFDTKTDVSLSPKTDISTISRQDSRVLLSPREEFELRIKQRQGFGTTGKFSFKPDLKPLSLSRYDQISGQLPKQQQRTRLREQSPLQTKGRSRFGIPVQRAPRFLSRPTLNILPPERTVSKKKTSPKEFKKASRIFIKPIAPESVLFGFNRRGGRNK